MTPRTRRCRYCLTVNGPRARKCAACKKALPKRRKPAHLIALKLPYEHYVALNGGDRCGVVTCGRGPSAKRKLDRDHDHATGKPRGLLCVRHNRMLDSRVTPEELRAMADYLEKEQKAVCDCAGRPGLLAENGHLVSCPAARKEQGDG